MKVLFDNESFSFETLRTTGFASGTPTKFQFQSATGQIPKEL